MVPRQEKPNIAENRRPLMLKDQGKRPHGIKKQRSQQPVRKSVRLQKQTIPKDKDTNAKYPLPSLPTSNTHYKEVKQSPLKAADSSSCQNKHRASQKRKRSQAEAPRDEPPEKRAQTSLTSCVIEDKEAARNTNKGSHIVEHWIQEGSWPKEYFEPGNMDLLPKRRKSIASLREDSEANTSFIGGDATQAARNPDYEKQLIIASIYLGGGEGTISDDCVKLCDSLLNGEQSIPKVSLFSDNLVETTFSRYLHRNESMVFRDITPLVVPSAELLHTFGSAHLEDIREDLNTLWTKCICLASGPRPKPDFVVGLKESVFTKDEHEKLIPYVGCSKEISYIKVTNDIFFPFLTCEVKCGEVGLAIADRQNAHSASIAVNAIVQLYKAVEREREINRKVLAFSISHDNETVRIYGHYAIINGEKITFHRYAIHKFDFTALNGKERWTAYKFTRNVYDNFLPAHIKRIKSAVIQLRNPKDLVESPTSIRGAENDPESQEMPPPSQDTVSRNKRQVMQQEIDRLKEQLMQRDDQLRDQVNQFLRQLAHRDEQLELQRREMKQENDELKDRINQLVGQIDLLLKQQALPMSQIEKVSNSTRLQSSEASGLSQVLEDQSLSKQSNPNTTSVAGNDDSQSNLANSITSNTSLSYGIEPESSQKPRKRRQGVGRK